MTETGPAGLIIASRFVGFVVCACTIPGIVSKAAEPATKVRRFMPAPTPQLVL